MVNAVFETIRVIKNKTLFLEDHYFRLMASMRILRMEIPMNFTLEFFENEILKLIKNKQLEEQSSRIKFMVNRVEGGLFTPKANTIEYIIYAEALNTDLYTFNDLEYRVDLYKDFYISPSLISTLKSNNRLVNIIGSIYAEGKQF